MFGLGIFTYIKIGLVVVVLAVCGYYFWNYHHMEAKIVAQQAQIDSLKLEQKVQTEKQKAFDEFMVKQTAIKRRVNNEKAQINKEVDTADDAGLRALYDRYRRLPDGKVGPAPDGKSGRAKPAPRGPAGRD
jgi:hypothetical protein